MNNQKNVTAAVLVEYEKSIKKYSSRYEEKGIALFGRLAELPAYDRAKIIDFVLENLKYNISNIWDNIVISTGRIWFHWDGDQHYAMVFEL